MFTSVRRRLVAWYAAVFAVVLAVIVGSGYLALTMSFDNAVDSELSARLAQQEGLANRVGISRLASQEAARLGYDLVYPAVFVIVTDSHGRVLSAPNGLEALALPDPGALQQAFLGHADKRIVGRKGQHVLLLTAPVRAGASVVGA